MKQIINALKGTIAIALIIFSSANAQNVVSSSSKFSSPNNLPYVDVTTKVSAPVTTANISQRAIKDFAKMNKSKIEPVWSIMESGGFTASYADAGVQSCVYYDKKGNWTCNINRYDESKMSKEIRQLIKPVFYDYKISGVAEITLPENIVHLVYLQENATNFKTVRICNGEMDVIEWIKDNKIMKL